MPEKREFEGDEVTLKNGRKALQGSARCAAPRSMRILGKDRRRRWSGRLRLAEPRQRAARGAISVRPRPPSADGGRVRSATVVSSNTRCTAWPHPPEPLEAAARVGEAV